MLDLVQPRSSREELAWAAGFFDGEGCFSYTQAGGYACVTIAQTIREPLDRFQRAVDVGNVIGPYVVRSPNRPSKRDQYVFRAYGTGKVLHVARLLWTHLGSLKQTQALATLRRASDRSPHSELHSVEPVAVPLPCCSRRQELAWAAGFFDADGSFVYSNASKYMLVSITQFDSEVLHRLQNTLGLGRIYGPYQHRPGATLSDKSHYRYQAHGHEAVQAIAAMLWFKLGSAKRKQAAAVIAKWPRVCHRGHRLTRGHSGCGACTAEYWQSRRKRNPTAQSS